MRKDAGRLVRQARRDVENARKIVATGAYEVVAFLSQQAGVPYELYDEPTARAKVEAAEEVADWVEKLLA